MGIFRLPGLRERGRQISPLLRYLLRDEFLTAAAAPLASPHTCEPGPGTLTISDNPSAPYVFSIAGGELVVSGTAYAARHVATGLFARQAGRALGFTITDTTTIDASTRLGLEPANPGNLPDYGVRYASASQLQAAEGAVALDIYPSGTAPALPHRWWWVLRNTGCFLFLNTTLVWVFGAGTDTSLLLQAWLNDAKAYSFKMDGWRVRDLGGAFATDEGIAVLNLTTFDQSLGAELVVNGGMESPPGGPPANWSAGNSAALTGAADERTGGAGVQSIDVARQAVNFPYAFQQFTVAPGSWHWLDGWRKNIDSSSGIVIVQRDVTNSVYVGSLQYSSGASWAHIAQRGRCKGATLQIWLLLNASAAGQHGRFDDISLKRINLNTQQVMPADALVDFAFTLPASPYAKQMVDLFYRISDASLEAGENYWNAKVERRIDNTAWDYSLNSVLNGVSTNRVAVNDVGAPDTVRVICQGAKHNGYTKQGSTWTKRGSEVDVSHNDTATGLNVMYDPPVTPVSLKAYPRTSSLYAELDRL